MSRRYRLVAWRARELRRAVLVERHVRRELVVSVRGEPGAQRTAGVGLVLADLVSSAPGQARTDLAGTDQTVGIGGVFASVAALAQGRHTRVTVHRASAGQRAVLRRYGLGRLLRCSDQVP
ncbi:hypothetical protein [Streptomyces sp. NPDC020983]|uniref:hypothetical protein n=1 Tax=Streptomyces sp. NPDC020983 TaxID=3365106 RepID=UPI003797A27A